MLIFRIFWKVGVVSVAFAALSACAQAITVTVDGQVVNFPDAQPRMIGGSVFVPMRGVFEQMGANVQWDQAQRYVEIDEGKHTISMRAEGKSAMVDNRAVNLDARARIEHGSVMVPLRFVATALGCQVAWDQASQTVTIQTDGHFIGDSRKPARRKVGG